MLAQLLSKLESQERPFLGPNYKSLTFWGLKLSQNLKKKYFYCFMNLALVIFVVTEWIEIWFLKSDMSLILNNMQVTLLASMSVIKVMTFMYWQNDWDAIIDYVTKADLIQRKSSDAGKLNIIKKYTKYSRIATYIFWSIALSTASANVLIPLLKYILSSSYRANTSNGSEKYVEVVSSWVPFDKNTMIGYLGASLYQIFASYYAAGWILSYDATVMVLMVFFRGELEMLRIDSSKIFGDETQSITEADAFSRLKGCHRRHLEMMKYAKLFDSCLSPIMLLYTFVCSVMLCVTAYQITTEGSVGQKLMSVQYLLAIFSQLFIYCWHSNDVLYASQDLMLGTYESTWCNVNVKRRKDLYILAEQFRPAVVFTVGPFGFLNLPTFINILKGAYSYYTLLSSSQGK